MKIKSETFSMLLGVLFAATLVITARRQDRKAQLKQEAIAWIEKMVASFDKPDGHENAAGHCEDIFLLFEKYSLAGDENMSYCAEEILEKACRAQLASIEIPKQNRDKYAKQIAGFQFTKPANINNRTNELRRRNELVCKIVQLERISDTSSDGTLQNVVGNAFAERIANQSKSCGHFLCPHFLFKVRECALDTNFSTIFLF